MISKKTQSIIYHIVKLGSFCSIFPFYRNKNNFYVAKDCKCGFYLVSVTALLIEAGLSYYLFPKLYFNHTLDSQSYIVLVAILLNIIFFTWFTILLVRNSKAVMGFLNTLLQLNENLANRHEVDLNSKDGMELTLNIANLGWINILLSFLSIYCFNFYIHHKALEDILSKSWFINIFTVSCIVFAWFVGSLSFLLWLNLCLVYINATNLWLQRLRRRVSSSSPSSNNNNNRTPITPGQSTVLLISDEYIAIYRAHQTLNILFNEVFSSSVLLLSASLSLSQICSTFLIVAFRRDLSIFSTILTGSVLIRIYMISSLCIRLALGIHNSSVGVIKSQLNPLMRRDKIIWKSCQAIFVKVGNFFKLKDQSFTLKAVEMIVVISVTLLLAFGQSQNTVAENR